MPWLCQAVPVCRVTVHVANRFRHATTPMITSVLSRDWTLISVTESIRGRDREGSLDLHVFK